VIRAVIDMNLGPAWIEALASAGIDAVHCSAVGALNAPDAVIFAWAANHDRVVITCDLDFSQILATSGARKPSVVVIRARNVVAAVLARHVASVLLQNEDLVKQGALIMLDATRHRLRVLPLRS